MKKFIIGFTVLFCLSFAFSQNYPNALDSNPEKMQWMQGFPPAKEKTLHAQDGSYFVFPGLRYSVNHMQEFSLTRTVSAPKEKLYSVKKKAQKYMKNLLQKEKQLR